VQPDELCGYRLHDADAATNKVLALAGRNELRDFVDVLYLDETYLSLGAMIWAACGKDPGYTPDFLLDQAARHTSYAQQELDLLLLKKPMNMPAMKQQWLQALERARDLIASLPREEIGCLYLDADGVVVDPDPSAEAFAGLTRHRGSMRGAWPTLS
jgi:PAS domain-containing protein